METIKIIDLLKGKTTYKYYTKYRETQWYNRDEINEYQISKLKKLIHHCYDNIPYYTKIMKSDILFKNNSELQFLKIP